MPVPQAADESSGYGERKTLAFTSWETASPSDVCSVDNTPNHRPLDGARSSDHPVRQTV